MYRIAALFRNPEDLAGELGGETRLVTWVGGYMVMFRPSLNTQPRGASEVDFRNLCEEIMLHTNIFGGSGALFEGWIQDGSNWRGTRAVNKIDTHHHLVPDFYAKAIKDAGGDPTGWPTPSWSPESTLALMDRLGVRTTILSLTAPGPCLLSGQAARDLARRTNEYLASLRDQHPERLGFFVCLPDLLDTAAALEEIQYGLDVLRGDGVVLYTRYGGDNGRHYLGNADLAPIWHELDARRAVVFVHPTASADATPVSAALPQPWADFPHETTRAALDLMTSGTRARFPNCSVILSHAGGTLPYLINRVTMALRGVPDHVLRERGQRTYDEMWSDFRSFHYDLANSSGNDTVALLMKLVGPDKILYGTDYPYAPASSYPAFLEEMEKCELSMENRDKIYFKNAMKLFPRLDSGNAKSKM